jgi:hypothetical protein
MAGGTKGYLTEYEVLDLLYSGGIQDEREERRNLMFGIEFCVGGNALTHRSFIILPERPKAMHSIVGVRRDSSLEPTSSGQRMDILHSVLGKRGGGVVQLLDEVV